LAFSQLHSLVVAQYSGPDLWPFSVQHNRTGFIWTLPVGLTDTGYQSTMIGMVCVGEVEPSNVHAKVKHLHNRGWVSAGGADSADDLRFADMTGSFAKNVVIGDFPSAIHFISPFN
jgi:hypothetical protein